ncbi:DNA modification methylase [Bellilinea caldifistulae]|nr:DNA modification methylase [Bellilinea caldifistulae]
MVVASSDIKKQLKTLSELLQGDLDFHQMQSSYASHNFHSFPAKFPPQLPHVFIQNLTDVGEIVLDPMNGSGTTVLEARLAKRIGIGLDIDPLALKISQVKTCSLKPLAVYETGLRLLKAARMMLDTSPEIIENYLQSRWDDETRQFVDYWFLKSVQRELASLRIQIEKIDDLALRRFFDVVFSGIIITKSGGVSMALDLAHTRPHRVKQVLDKNSQILFSEIEESQPPRSHWVKKYRSPFEEFEKKLKVNIRGLQEITSLPVYHILSDAQKIPLKDNIVDLIVTSPPYASNAIDYMRAHKFSLVWLGYSISSLSSKRSEYIGAESQPRTSAEVLPAYTQSVIVDISSLDKRKGMALERYYSEMKRVLTEIYRVLKPGKCAIVVVATSILRGRNTQTHLCLADIGKQLGFIVPEIGVRNLDRDKRMMPATLQNNSESQIQQRMHEEYVIGFYKPA